jgi:hypothetical protein
MNIILLSVAKEFPACPRAFVLTTAAGLQAILAVSLLLLHLKLCASILVSYRTVLRKEISINEFYRSS